jgi:hypothetical protein
VSALAFTVAVIETRPLRIHAWLHHLPPAEDPVLVPRPFAPIGLFVAVTIRDAAGADIFHTEQPKVRLKLDPSEPGSYVALDAGATYGAILDVPAPALPPGRYALHATYSNHQFAGPAGREFGPLAFEAAARFEVS